jgi:hypothetical protein
MRTFIYCYVLRRSCEICVSPLLNSFHILFQSTTTIYIEPHGDLGFPSAAEASPALLLGAYFLPDHCCWNVAATRLSSTISTAIHLVHGVCTHSTRSSTLTFLTIETTSTGPRDFYNPNSVAADVVVLIDRVKDSFFGGRL